MGEKHSTLITTSTVPSCYAKPVFVDRNPIQQILIRSQQATIKHGENHREISVQLETGEAIYVTSGSPQLSPGERVLRVPKASFGQLHKSGNLSSATWAGDRRLLASNEVNRSLAGQFRFKADNRAQGIYGLRSPQLGAVHAVLGYWTTNEAEPATVVMPTGTGKTDTMIALFCAAEVERLLIVVPTDTLRSQIAEKVMSLGVLQNFEVVSRTCHRPVVGQIKHGFKTVENAVLFADQCNVMVATPSALSASSVEVRNALFACCSHLFVDEAHHVTASTWRIVCDEFSRKPVVQFTATPFREDGRHLGGRFVYKFPLREAQRQGYFSRIDYVSVLDLGNHDRTIAQRAIEKLREDLAAGYDHLIMARVKSIRRATEVLSIYQQLAPDLGPDVLHSQLR
ncbi:DEAD/DEAH box helicase, partial [Nitrolancea hollandica]|uniref:DEAD/DEAH box helicase n=1 Tax=Nitrolancea hollandica TaxID=1206749 RepID=UPI00135F1164